MQTTTVIELFAALKKQIAALARRLDDRNPPAPPVSSIPTEPDNRLDRLLEMARQAMLRSYSPYSGYPVGAALLCADGRVFQGCNIENASFGLTNCAERTAMFKAVSEGAREFTAIAIASRDAAPWPCGACRQVLNEFAPNIRVLVTWQGGTESATLPELLPHGFGPQQLTTKE